MPYPGQATKIWRLAWPKPTTRLPHGPIALRRSLNLPPAASLQFMAVADGSSSGIHWRSGVIVTAEKRLEGDDNIKVTLPGGRLVEAALAGRDPTTDVAVLRFQPDGLPIASIADGSLRTGHI